MLWLSRYQNTEHRSIGSGGNPVHPCFYNGAAMRTFPCCDYGRTFYIGYSHDPLFSAFSRGCCCLSGVVEKEWLLYGYMRKEFSFEWKQGGQRIGRCL